jgi:hypothetical protein
MTPAGARWALARRGARRPPARAAQQAWRRAAARWVQARSGGGAKKAAPRDALRVSAACAPRAACACGGAARLAQRCVLLATAPRGHAREPRRQHAHLLG